LSLQACDYESRDPVVLNITFKTLPFILLFLLFFFFEVIIINPCSGLKGYFTFPVSSGWRLRNGSVTHLSETLAT
jgi:hypothetical protein